MQTQNAMRAPRLKHIMTIFCQKWREHSREHPISWIVSTGNSASLGVQIIGRLLSFAISIIYSFLNVALFFFLAISCPHLYNKRQKYKLNFENVNIYTNKSFTNWACSVINRKRNSGFLPISSETMVRVFSVSSAPSSVRGGKSTRIRRRVLGDIVVSFN